jgi:hypothetical protein
MSLIWTAADQVAAQNLLLANATGVNSSVTACTALSSTDQSAWTTFYQAVQTFCAQVPVDFFPTGTNEVLQTSGLADQLQAYQAQLLAYQQKFSKTCNISVPTPVTPTTPGLQTLQYVAVAAGIIGVAWAVSSIVEETKLVKGPMKAVRRLGARA